MALQVRRGTNAERLGITPLAGELIYVTDTKQLYIGDGTTAGGTTSIANTIDSVVADTSPQLGGELDLNGNNITGTGNINITGTISASGNINLGDGVGSDILVIGGSIQGHLVPDTDITWNLGSTSKHFNEAWISQLNVENQLTVGRIMGDLIADDSTVVFDASTGLVAAAQLTGTLPAGVIPAAMSSNITGNLTGNANGSHTGTFDGDMIGSLFADDSTLVVDGINGSMHASSFIPNGNIIEVSSISAATSVKQQIISLDSDSELNLTRKSASDLSASSATLGTISFGVEDSNGAKSGAIILGNRNSLYLMADGAGTFSNAALAVTLTDGKLAVGSFGPATEKLDVVGNIKASGSIQPGVYADNTARDAAITSPVAGMMVFNTTGTKFQGYTGSAWVDLN
jgi:hypothetical protein